MIDIEINNRTVAAHEGEPLLDVLRRSGNDVPTLCHLADLFPSGACRMCVVELEDSGRLVPSCAFPVTAGMKVRTHSQRVLTARKTIVELLLADHPDDCLYCDRNSNCELRRLAATHGVRQRRYQGNASTYHLDSSSPSIVRDPAKCILCGRCVRVCEEIQGVSAIDFVGRGSQTHIGTAFDEGLNVGSCVNCGQCIMVCPTGALRSPSAVKKVSDAIAHPERVVVVQHAPAVSVTLAEELGLKSGLDVAGAMTTALRQIGFNWVFDTSFTADLTIMEEASELVHRLHNGGPLPMMTSCSPAWIKFVEHFYPDYIDNLSTCKSPQQMMGAIVKTFFAQRQGIDPKQIFSVSIMPCTAKKFEAQRTEMARDGMADVDAVLTTRELAHMIRRHGLDLEALAPGEADTPFGRRSSAGKLFGATGGVMEAAVRTAHYLVTGQELDTLEVSAVRGLDGVKEARVNIAGTQLGVAVVSGLNNAKRLLEEIRSQRKELHFIEVMSCPGGCIAGGGQPHGAPKSAIRNRLKALYQIDQNAALRTSHENQAVQTLYDEFLGAPLGHKSHELLHTRYQHRDVTI